IAGVDVRELAEKHGTPLFVVDEADFKSRCADYAEAFDDPSLVHYASKAFLSIEVARWVAEQGLSLDVCSGGELAVAQRADFPAERITFHGNNKSPAELEAAIVAGVGTIVLDSYFEIARLADIAARHDVVQPVLIRVTVGVEAHTHEFIATAHEDQKFGFSISSGDAAEAVRRVLKCEGLRLVGLHSHIGSQIYDPDGFEIAAHRVIGLLAALRDEHGDHALASVQTVDLGGGLGIAYTVDDDPPPVAELAAQLLAIVAREADTAGLPRPRVVVEPGRAIAGPGTVTLYEVGTLKDVELAHNTYRRYVSVDGGMSDNIRTALYDAVYDCRLVSRPVEPDAGAVLSRVVGKHCESGDVVVRDCWLPGDVAPGDLIAVAATGAYCYAMASGYNRLPRPAVVAVRDGVAKPLLRRESEQDLFRLEAE
ncbi:MAG TPA: diaminopimelate decarboxylase, partial [Pseudonocardiaceae bacterium]|nr:diaminopimelate decarboxylase [Pseudonocardiaceae bacterium]